MSLPIDEYKKLMEISPICTVDILFFHQAKAEILLFRRVNKPYKDVYFSIGGRMEKNETFEQCAIRQIKRELGLDVSQSELIFGGVLNEIHQESTFEDINYHSVNIYFGCIWQDRWDKLVNLDSQHTDHKWFDIDDQTIHHLVRSKIEILKPILQFRKL